jgi:hypothetical protein
MTQTLPKPQTQATAVPTRQRRWWQFALEFVVLFPLAILALEGLLNLSGVGQEEFLEPDAELGVRHIPGQKVVWRLEGFSNESFNRAGLRDTEHALTKPADVFRIALLGDSATEGMQVTLDKTYGKQLEKMLNSRGIDTVGKRFEVINFGCSSYSNGQEMLQLKSKVLPYKPDLVVLMYNRGDFVENIRDPRTLKAEPRPYFYRDAAGNLVQDNAVMEVNKHGFEPHPVAQFLQRNSRIYGILSHLNLALSLNEPLYAKIKGTLTKKLDRSTAEIYANYKQTYPIQDVWGVTEAIIKNTHQICVENNSKFIVVCFPNIVNDKDYTAQIKRLGAMSKEMNFGYCDLTYSYMYSKDPKALFLKYHFSNAGHELAAQALNGLTRNMLSQAEATH